MAERPQYEELARHLSAMGTVRRGLARALPHDCPPASVAVLMLLHRLGRIRQSELAELLAVDTSVTSRQVTHLEARGWIDRQPDPLDGRSRLLRLNAGGEELLAQVSARYTQTLSDRLSDWSDHDVYQLNALLTRLLASFGDSRCHGLSPRQAMSTPTDPAPASHPSSTITPLPPNVKEVHGNDPVGR